MLRVQPPSSSHPTATTFASVPWLRNSAQPTLLLSQYAGFKGPKLHRREKQRSSDSCWSFWTWHYSLPPPTSTWDSMTESQQGSYWLQGQRDFIYTGGQQQEKQNVGVSFAIYNADVLSANFITSVMLGNIRTQVCRGKLYPGNRLFTGLTFL